MHLEAAIRERPEQYAASTSQVEDASTLREPSAQVTRVPAAHQAHEDFHDRLRELWTAPDGTVALADAAFGLYVFIASEDRPTLLTGHLAPPLQLIFAEDASTLAVAQRDRVTFVACATGVVTEEQLPVGDVEVVGRHSYIQCD